MRAPAAPSLVATARPLFVPVEANANLRRVETLRRDWERMVYELEQELEAIDRAYSPQYIGPQA